jgi:hypothetical protein
VVQAEAYSLLHVRLAPRPANDPRESDSNQDPVS